MEAALFGNVIGLLKAISDPTRLKLVKLLQAHPMCVCELTDALAIAQPTVSQHLRRLKAVGLVSERREGQMVCYSLVEHDFARLRRALADVLDAPAGGIPAMAMEWQRSQSAGGHRHCADGEQPPIPSGHTNDDPH